MSGEGGTVRERETDEVEGKRVEGREMVNVKPCFRQNRRHEKKLSRNTE